MKKLLIFYTLFTFNSCNKVKVKSISSNSYKGKSWSNMDLEEELYIQYIYDYINLSFEYIKRYLSTIDQTDIIKEYEFWIYENKLIRYLLLYFNKKVNNDYLKENSYNEKVYLDLLETLSLDALKKVIEEDKNNKKVFYYSNRFYKVSKKVNLKLINKLLNMFMNNSIHWNEFFRKEREYGVTFSCISSDFYKKLNFLINYRGQADRLERNREYFRNLREKFHEILYILLYIKDFNEAEEIKIRNLLKELFEGASIIGKVFYDMKRQNR